MKSFIASVAVSLAAFLSLAATYPVTDYSWLQLPEGITPSAGNPSNPVVTSGWTSHGSIDYIRGSMWVWIANTDLTGKGAYDFWGAVHMDPPRNVKKINATLWGQAGSTWRRFKVEGSIDGETFTQIGEYDAGDWRNDHWTQIKGLEVTNGTYKAIRLRFNGTDSQPDDPDYAWDNAGYGGPGITMLEPIGDGELSAEEVNFVNGPNFNTTCINNVDWNAGQKFNTGTLDDSQMVGERIDATGNGWDEGHYMQVDLGQERRIYRSALAFCQGYSCNGFSFAYSTDGETWHDIVDPVGPTFRFANSIIDYNFQPVTARYWRITGATGGNQYALISQWMLYGTEREPLSLDAHDLDFEISEQNRGTLQLSDLVDNASEAFTYTITPSSMRQLDVGTTRQVHISVTDGTLNLATNVNVTVSVDESCAGRVLVTDYNWLQTPPEFVTSFAGTSQNPYFTSGNCSNGNVDWMRWGADYTILSQAALASGANDYWLGQKFATPRFVHTVRVSIWTDATRTLRRFSIEGSADGETYTRIASQDFGAFANNNPKLTMPVTPGVYKAIRIRFNGSGSQPGDPDYTSGNGHGGPGLIALEPIGDGILDYEQVNWAQRGNFDTVASTVNNPKWNGRNFNDGCMWDQNQCGTENPWVEGTRIVLDLGTARQVCRTILANNLSYGPNKATFLYSTDGANWHALATLPPTLHTGDTHGALEYQFAPTTARYWAIDWMEGPSWCTLIDEWMLFATEHQAPVQIAHDAIYQLDGSGRKLEPEDVDGGSYDPEGLPYTKTLSRQEFGLDDVGKTVAVRYTLDNGFSMVFTNVNVTVHLGANVGDKIPVTAYNWLQLPDQRVSVETGMLSANLDIEPATLRTGYTDKGYIRWGGWVWIPHGQDLKGTNYFAAVRFDEPRNVSRVEVQFWIHGSEDGIGLNAFHVDGQDADGAWSEIGFNDFGEKKTWSFEPTTVAVSNGTYQAVRVRIMAGEYTCAPNAGFGGPGIDSINPIGAGLVERDEINWANAANFDAHCSWYGVNNARGSATDNTYLDGDFVLFQEWQNAWVGSNGRGFNDGDYIQVDLGKARWLSGVTTLWSYIAKSFEIQASLDGETFADVPLEDPWIFADRTIHYDFSSAVRARYVRLVNADASVKGHALMDRIMVFGANSPGTLFLLK